MSAAIERCRDLSVSCLWSCTYRLGAQTTVHAAHEPVQEPGGTESSVGVALAWRRGPGGCRARGCVRRLALGRHRSRSFALPR